MITRAEDLKPGDRIALYSWEPDHSITVLGAREPWTDPVGRTMFKYWCEYDGRQGYMLYGPGGVVNRAES